MSKLHVISDPHFGHENMAKERGFSCAEEQDEEIIRRWNSKVSKKDSVWILGDITMEKSNYDILDRLNGVKKVVLGNHDRPQHVPKLLKYVNSVCGSFKKDGIWLTHIPMHPTELIGSEFNVHGHIHEKSVGDGRYINVSCEAVGYVPVEWESIKKWKKDLSLKIK